MRLRHLMRSPELNALLRGDMIRVLSVVQQGIASEAHAEFVRRLHEKATSR